MEWWRQARFGMFVHYGVYALLGRNEWSMAFENWEPEEYEEFARQFRPKQGCTREWAKLASEAGAKYMVLTTRHHEGFSLWDSAINPYNMINTGSRFDLVKEYVESCREFGLKVGFYFSLMDWHHPDGGNCAFDTKSRQNFLLFIEGMLKELMTNYGKIDILWYDVARPMESPEGWNSLQMNQMVRTLQPDIIINNRSKLPEDFGTPEEHLDFSNEQYDWEACMTFNRLSWGYVDSETAKNYSYNAHQILQMINEVGCGGGNLLLNIGPKPDGSIPEEVITSLQKVGRWLHVHREAVYRRLYSTDRITSGRGSGLGRANWSEHIIYYWCFIWPGKEFILGGYLDTLQKVRLISTGDEYPFTQNEKRIVVTGLPEKCPETSMGIAVFALEFDKKPEYCRGFVHGALYSGKTCRAKI